MQKIAPFLSTALSLGGPLGTMAGSAITTALGAKPGSKVEDVLTSLTKTPLTQDQIAAVQKAENDFQLQMKTLDIQSVEDLEKLADDDRASARTMQEQVKASAPQIISGFFVAGFFIVTILKLAHVIAETDQTVNDLITTLRDGLMLILAFYFGSSRGQEAQAKTISDIAKS
jgi:hypothetical protein